MHHYLVILRPHQWLKNLMLLFPPFLGGTLLQFEDLAAFVLPLISFCCAASAVYIVNDILDLQQDRHHPLKRLRPIADGRITPPHALIYSLLLASLAIWTAVQVSRDFLIIVLLYLVISSAYSLRFKSLPVVEMFCVISGFLLRLQAGSVAYEVELSNWLILSVFLLALFLVSGKRLGEIRHTGGATAGLLRPVLEKYPSGFFEVSMGLSGAAVLVTYSLYLINYQGNIFLIPLCCFGLLSYLLRVLTGKGGDPTRALLKDPVLFIVGLLWFFLTSFTVYGT